MHVFFRKTDYIDVYKTKIQFENLGLLTKMFKYLPVQRNMNKIEFLTSRSYMLMGDSTGVMKQEEPY